MQAFICGIALFHGSSTRTLLVLTGEIITMKVGCRGLSMAFRSTQHSPQRPCFTSDQRRAKHNAWGGDAAMSMLSGSNVFTLQEVYVAWAANPLTIVCYQPL